MSFIYLKDPKVYNNLLSIITIMKTSRTHNCILNFHYPENSKCHFSPSYIVSLLCLLKIWLSTKQYTNSTKIKKTNPNRNFLVFTNSIKFLILHNYPSPMQLSHNPN